MPRIKAFVGNVLDGNTLEATIGINAEAYSTTIVLARVYAPPLTRVQGREAKRELKRLINRRHITYEVVGANPENVHIAEVWLNDVNVNDLMMQKGYGRKIDWPIEPDWQVR